MKNTFLNIKFNHKIGKETFLYVSIKKTFEYKFQEQKIQKT